jgi:hypothetical protein
VFQLSSSSFLSKEKSQFYNSIARTLDHQIAHLKKIKEKLTSYYINHLSMSTFETLNGSTSQKLVGVYQTIDGIGFPCNTYEAIINE